MTSLRLTVDRSRCVGIGQCEALHPEVFEIDDDALSTVLEPGTLPADQADAVAAACPSGAISIGDPDSSES